MNIHKLINTNEWNKIYKLIKNNKIDPNEEISNGNTIIHIAATNNKEEIVKYFAKNDYHYLEISNKEGNTAIHLLAQYGYIDLLKICLIENFSNFINLLNNNNENILNILYNDFKFIKWVVTNEKFNCNKDNIIVNDIDDKNIINKNIDESNKKDDNAYQIIKLLLKHCTKQINDYNDSFLCYAINNYKTHIAKLFINEGYDLDKKNKSYLTPFLYAAAQKDYKLMQLLIKKGCDINYNGPEGDQNPMIFAIKNNDNDMVELLLNNNYKLNSYNRYLETPLHYALYNENKLSPTVISTLLYYSNLNAKNIHGVTPLHLLCKNNNIKNYNEIVKYKELDIFAEDGYQKKPLDYINGNYIYPFMDIVVDSYIRQLDGKIDNINECKVGINSKNCYNELKKHIFQTKRSIPIKVDQMRINSRLNMIIGNHAIHGLFNSDTLHNMIYTILMLKQYKNVGIPYQFMIEDKFINDKMIVINNNLYNSIAGKIISDLVLIYLEHFYEILPYLMIWKSNAEHYIHKDIGFMIKKTLKIPYIRFIFMKLTLVTTVNSTHANIIIYDKVKNTLERFEPYGNVPYLESNLLDAFIENMGKKHINRQLTYFKPKDIIGDVGFQTISNDNNPDVKKLGDPAGFCLAWTIWYLEMRINNPDIDPKTLISNIKESILSRDKSSSPDKLFINFIRNYASGLDKQKNEFMKSAGININNIYNLVLDQKDQNKVINKLSQEFNMLLN